MTLGLVELLLIVNTRKPKMCPTIYVHTKDTHISGIFGYNFSNIRFCKEFKKGGSLNFPTTSFQILVLYMYCINQYNSYFKEISVHLEVSKLNRNETITRKVISDGFSIRHYITYIIGKICYS